MCKIYGNKLGGATARENVNRTGGSPTVNYPLHIETVLNSEIKESAIMQRIFVSKEKRTLS